MQTTEAGYTMKQPHMQKPFNQIQRNLVHRAALGLTALALAFSGCTAANDQQAAAAVTEPETMKTAMVYVGTYAEPDAESIFLYSLNPETGELTRVRGMKGGENPSYLALSPDKRHLYAVNETTEYEGEKSGAVSAFAVGEQGDSLHLLSKAASKGGAPCYVSLQGNTVLVANYVGGNVTAYPVQENGQLGEGNTVQHQGTGPNAKRQDAPHAHFIAPSPDGKYSFAVDLGADKVFAYKLQEGRLVPHAPAVAYAAAPGSGPRHLAFHPNGKYAYLIHELNSTVTALAYNAAHGTFTELQTLGTLPPDFEGESYPAAVKVSPDGKFLYGSNRGHNSMVVYAIDEAAGKLTLVQHVSTGGDWPRDFSIDPSGRVLLVANQRSDNITSFKIDTATGKLTATGHEAQVQKPVNLVFR